MTGGMARWRWLWLPIAFMLTCAGWAVASPVGSAPDDDYHLASIWCAAGEPDCSPGDTPGTVLVPINVAQAADCYRYDNTISADCTAQMRSDSTRVAVSHVNQLEALYPTGYYSLMSLLVSDNVEASVTGMRMLNILIVGLLLALLLRTAPAGIAFATSTTLAVAFIPLGLFILGSTNPSGWATAGLLLFWGFASALLQRRTWRSRRTWLVTLGTLATAGMVLSSRVDAAAYLAVASVIVLILGGAKALQRRPTTALLVLTIGVVAAWTYLSFDTPGGGGGDATLGSASRGLGLLLTNLVYLPVLLQGAVGGMPLGWNDTVMPPLVPIVGVLVLGGFIWAGLGRLWPAKAAAVTLSLMAWVLIPLWFLQKEGLGVGEVVQSRYLLPLLCVFLATVLLDRNRQRPLALPRNPTVIAAAALWVSASIAFWANVHRYSYGPDVGLFDLREAPVWLGSSGLHPAVLAVLVTAVTGVWLAGSLLPRLRGEQPMSRVAL